MIELRKGDERGYFNFGWLETYHSFSFAQYFDPKHVRFGSLRVLNEDFIRGGTGFDTHPHNDMEIVTYVLSGSLRHRDSTGGEGLIEAGELQRMTAGSGIFHSEFNADDSEVLHLLQIWFVPERTGLKPGYEQKQIKLDAKNKLALVVSNRPSEKNLNVHQDLNIYVSHLEAGKEVGAEVGDGRLGYLHNAMVGEIDVNGKVLKPGDGLKITGPENLSIMGVSAGNSVLFEMAGSGE